MADAVPIVSADPGDHPYCRTDPAALGSGDVLERAAGRARRFAEFFDGRRDPQQRLDAARERYGDAVDTAVMQEAAIDLALAGVLEPGQRESLPAPGQVERDPWNQKTHRLRRHTVPLPTLFAGTLAAPGLPGALAGSFGGQHRGMPDEVEVALSPRRFAAIGRIFSAPARHPSIAWALLVLFVTAVCALWNLRIEVLADAAKLPAWHEIAIMIATSAVLVNIATQSARLVTIQRATGQWPRFGLRFQLGFIPLLFTDTSGAAENADTRGRGQILASPLLARLMVSFLAQFGWLLMRHDSGVLAPYCLSLAGSALIQFVFTINPLARRDGYFWLAYKLDAPDLREQSWMALFGWYRPWANRAVPHRNLRYGYAALSGLYALLLLVLYVIFPARWIELFFGGPGVAVFVAVLAYAIYRQMRRGLYFRTSLEPFRLKLPTFSKATWIVFGVIAVLFFVPYPYEPSGKAVVLPRDRADVRALVAGDVQQVLVQEGDMVKAGQELLLISDVETKAQVAAAEADLQRAQAELAIVKKGGASGEVQLAREKLSTARKRLEFADSQAKRLADAYRRKAVSPQEYDTARGQAEVRKQEVAEAEQSVRVIGNPARNERIESLEAEVVKAQAELNFRKEQLSNTRVTAPIAGRVVSDKLLFARGTYLVPGTAIALIEDSSALQAEIELPEATLGKVEMGAKAWLRVWAFPGSSFRGKVTHIAPDAETGLYGKIVRVRMELDDPDEKLKPEMTGQAKVRSHWTLAGFAFTRALVRFAMIEVWSWLP